MMAEWRITGVVKPTAATLAHVGNDPVENKSEERDNSYFGTTQLLNHLMARGLVG
jgi:hypothetical protein